MQEEPESVDLGGGASEDDPFAEIPSDPLPEGVEPGELGGYDPSQGGEPAEPDEFLQDPEAEEEDAPEEPVGDPGPTSEPESEPPPDPEPPAAEPEATPEPEPEPAEPAEFTPEPEAAEPEATEEATPEPEPPSSDGKRRRRGKQDRGYQILQRKSEKGPWTEEMVVDARTRDSALRVAYRKLAKKGGEDTLTLVAVAVGNWKPESVKGKRREDYAISIGG